MTDNINALREALAANVVTLPVWFGISCEPERGPVNTDYKSVGFYDNPAIFDSSNLELVGCNEYMVFSAQPVVTLLLAAVNAAPELIAALDKMAAEISSNQLAADAFRAGAIEALERVTAERDALAAAQARAAAR